MNRSTKHFGTPFLFNVQCKERSSTMSNRMDDPLIFSMDDHFVEEHLVRLDLRSKHLKNIDQLPNNIDFNVILLDKNELTEIVQLDRFTHLIQVM